MRKQSVSKTAILVTIRKNCTKVITFYHEKFGSLRAMEMPNGQIGFVGKDVTIALGYAKPLDAIAAHVDE